VQVALAVWWSLDTETVQLTVALAELVTAVATIGAPAAIPTRAQVHQTLHGRTFLPSEDGAEPYRPTRRFGG